MRYFNLLWAALALVTFLALPVHAGSIKNKDTAKDRQTSTWGTQKNETSGTATFEKNERGDTVITSSPPPKKEERDWYDNIVITVDHNEYSKDKTVSDDSGDDGGSDDGGSDDGGSDDTKTDTSGTD